ERRAEGALALARGGHEREIQAVTPCAGIDSRTCDVGDPHQECLHARFAVDVGMEHVPAASAKLVEALAIHDQVQVFVVLHELDLESRHLPDGYVDRDLNGVRGDLPHASAHRLLDL